jgi:hypothetical protein
MIGPNNIQDELIKDAITRSYGPIDKALKNLKKYEISQDVVDKMASKMKFDVNMVKRRADALGIKITESKTGDYQTVYDKYYKTKPQGYDKVTQDRSELDSFNVSDIYEFLYMGTTVKSPQKLPCDVLRQRAKDRETKEFYKSDSTSGSGKRLCQKSYEYFKSDATKKEYDTCLEYLKVRTILDGLRNLYQIIDEAIPEETYNENIRKLTEIFKDSKKAEKILIAFCKVEKISVPSSGICYARLSGNI